MFQRWVTGLFCESSDFYVPNYAPDDDLLASQNFKYKSHNELLNLII
jgi:hypothetical protein